MIMGLTVTGTLEKTKIPSEMKITEGTSMFNYQEKSTLLTQKKMTLWKVKQINPK